MSQSLGREVRICRGPWIRLCQYKVIYSEFSSIRENRRGDNPRLVLDFFNLLFYFFQLLFKFKYRSRFELFLFRVELFRLVGESGEFRLHRLDPFLLFFEQPFLFLLNPIGFVFGLGIFLFLFFPLLLQSGHRLLGFPYQFLGLARRGLCTLERFLQ